MVDIKQYLKDGVLIPSFRTVNLCIFLFALALMIIALFMQYAMGLEPCYLCLVQRSFLSITGCLALLAYLHNPVNIGRRFYASGIIFGAAAGAVFSIRQIWLQSLPEEQVPACGPPAEYLFDAFPFMEVIPILLRGDGNCALVQWTLFDISIPGYTLMSFSVVVLTGFWLLLRRN